MNNITKLTDYYDTIIDKITILISSTSNLISLLIIIAILINGFFIAKVYKKNVDQLIFTLPISQLLMPIICLFELAIYKFINLVMDYHYNKPLLNMISLFLVVDIIIRIIYRFSRYIFQYKSYVNFISNLIRHTMWVSAIVIITDTNDDIISFLDSIEFHLSKHYVISVWDILRDIAIFVAVLIFATLINQFITRKINKLDEIDSNLQQILIRFSKIIIFILACLFTLPLIGIDITALSIFGGAIGVGIGFGLQKITSNFLSGFIILIDRSIKVGDRLVVDNNVGSIAKITMRYVVMERFDGTEVLIPNETFITNNIQNQTYSNTCLRSDIVCNIGSQNDLYGAVSIIKSVIANAPNTISDKANASITRLIDGGVEVKGHFWVTSPNDITNVTNHIYIELAKLFTTGILKAPLTNQRIEVINKLWN